MSDLTQDEIKRRASLSDVARRALEEADARASEMKSPQLPDDERGGPKTIEPTRYGDWERNGRTSDF